MSALKSQIAGEVETLPAESKNKLAAKLIESIDEPSAAEIDALWGESPIDDLKSTKRAIWTPFPAKRFFAGWGGE